ncbi:N-acetylglucosaminyldiphosphoundecaprenol N-acetyl-beta-D-mannosaminyltransferase [Pseudacidovorax intermedius]|uniref:N-acetylglucosaminyldiphosphoundecaprenol N-acetyl-beta-D-mannosaminyltransferase n=2 Tax=Pseudacidovorax intermedius TaxID=433924 RepID=A0A370FEW8_9BURK|nr:N-acetylglucosaminyldiphosphoundecaprenol N-acetyl-beta-D-mannosaminyltransferase [Pseudacidovorax intermedius]
MGIPINYSTWEELIRKIDDWVEDKAPRYICICNVHSVVTASDHAALKAALVNSDLNTPDGGPLASYISKVMDIKQERLNGPDLMLRYTRQSSNPARRVYLYGATEKCLELLSARLRAENSLLDIVGSYSPPYRVLSESEKKEIIDRINSTEPEIVWVGLGCPKQEIWMHENSASINAVLIGVGAAFDYHAGLIHRAPEWMQRNNLEWLHRLWSEPRRLWRRYLYTNSRYLLWLFINKLRG